MVWWMMTSAGLFNEAPQEVRIRLFSCKLISIATYKDVLIIKELELISTWMRCVKDSLHLLRTNSQLSRMY